MLYILQKKISPKKPEDLHSSTDSTMIIFMVSNTSFHLFEPSTLILTTPSASLFLPYITPVLISVSLPPPSNFCTLWSQLTCGINLFFKHSSDLPALTLALRGHHFLRKLESGEERPPCFIILFLNH